MADFWKAIRVVLGQEGWAEYTNNHEDLGGATKFGITIGTLTKWRSPKPVAAGDVADLQLPESLDIYDQWFWDAMHGEGIRDQALATKILSIYVNTDPRDAILMVQRSVNAIGGALELDGTIGPLTLNAINAADPRALVDQIIKAQAAFYRQFGATHPEQAGEVPGLLVRAAWPYASLPTWA